MIVKTNFSNDNKSDMPLIYADLLTWREWIIILTSIFSCLNTLIIIFLELLNVVLNQLQIRWIIIACSLIYNTILILSFVCCCRLLRHFYLFLYFLIGTHINLISSQYCIMYKFTILCSHICMQTSHLQSIRIGIC